MLIHTTDRLTFRRCGLKWFYTSDLGLGLEPIRPEEPLFFGSLIHEALAAYYAPSNKPSPARDPGPMLDAWASNAKSSRKEWEEREGRMWEAEEENFDRLVALGQGMLEHYATWAPSNDNFRVLWVEKAFTIPVKPRSPHRYGFKCDGLVQDLDTGKVGILEHKTAATIYEREEWLDFDIQTGSYLWAINRVREKDGKKPAEFVIYNSLRKAVPNHLRVLKDGTLSADKSQSTTFKIAKDDLVAFYGTFAKILPKYHDLLGNLKGVNNFFKRSIVTRNLGELEYLGREIELDVKEMTRHARQGGENIVRSASRMNCESCVLRIPCLNRAEGNLEGEAEILATEFRQKEKRYA